MSPVINKHYTAWHNTNIMCSDENIGEGTKIGSFVEIGSDVKIGKNCKIEAFVFIPNGVTIEDNCFVGPGTIFINDKKPPSNGKFWQTTLVKKNVAIGANSTILCGITINEGAMVGAGSVVALSIPKSVIVCGNPAKVLVKDETTGEMRKIGIKQYLNEKYKKYQPPIN